MEYDADLNKERLTNGPGCGLGGNLRATVCDRELSTRLRQATKGTYEIEYQEECSDDESGNAQGPLKGVVLDEVPQNDREDGPADAGARRHRR